MMDVDICVGHEGSFLLLSPGEISMKYGQLSLNFIAFKL